MFTININKVGFPSVTNGNEPVCQSRRCKVYGFDPWVGKIPCRRACLPTPIFLPEASLEQRSLAGYGTQDHRKLDTIETMPHEGTYKALRKLFHRGNIQ